MQKEDCIAIYLAPLLPVLLALTSLADTAHSLFLHIDNTVFGVLAAFLLRFFWCFRCCFCFRLVLVVFCIFLFFFASFFWCFWSCFGSFFVGFRFGFGRFWSFLVFCCLFCFVFRWFSVGFRAFLVVFWYFCCFFFASFFWCFCFFWFVFLVFGWFWAFLVFFGVFAAFLLRFSLVFRLVLGLFWLVAAFLLRFSLVFRIVGFRAFWGDPQVGFFKAAAFGWFLVSFARFSVFLGCSARPNACFDTSWVTPTEQTLASSRVGHVIVGGVHRMALKKAQTDHFQVKAAIREIAACVDPGATSLLVSTLRWPPDTTALRRL